MGRVETGGWRRGNGEWGWWGWGEKERLLELKRVCRKAFDETIQLGVCSLKYRGYYSFSSHFHLIFISFSSHFHLIPSLECHGHAIRFVGIVGCVGVVKGSGQIVHVHHIERYVVVVDGRLYGEPSFRRLRLRCLLQDVWLWNGCPTTPP